MRQLIKSARRCRHGLRLAAGISSVAAHHSTTMFDHSKTLTINGDRRGAALGQPARQPLRQRHVNGSEDAPRWVMEMTSPGNLVRAGGWSRNAVKAGEKVEVEFSPLRDASMKGGALKKVTVLATGQVLTANIRAQEMPGLE